MAHMPKGYLHCKRDLTPEEAERIKDAWRKKCEGPAVGRTLMLPHYVEFVPIRDDFLAHTQVPQGFLDCLHGR